MLLETRAPESVEMTCAAERLREMPLPAASAGVALGRPSAGQRAWSTCSSMATAWSSLPAPRIDTPTPTAPAALSSVVAALLPQCTGQFRAVEAAVRDARPLPARRHRPVGQLGVGKGTAPSITSTLGRTVRHSSNQ